MLRNWSYRDALLAVTIAMACVDCTEQRIVSPSPTSVGGQVQSSAPPPQSGQTTLKGVVSDSGGRALVGATVELLDGPDAGRGTLTDATGWFTLVGTIQDTTQLRASKEGYVSRMGTVAFQRGDGPAGYVTFALAILDPPGNLAGDYQLTFTADEACQAVPGDLRTRTYAVTIEPDSSDPRVPPGTFFWASITSVPFLANQGRIPLLVAGNAVTFWLGEHGYGSFFVEHVAANTYLQFDGGTTVSVGTSPVSRIETTFEGAVDYCVLASPMTGLYWNCDQSRAVTSVRCESTRHRLTLTRR